MSEREPNPCPFCCCETGVMMRAGGTWRVWCLRPASVCGYIGPDKATEADAIAHHNRARSAILEKAHRDAIFSVDQRLGNAEPERVWDHEDHVREEARMQAIEAIRSLSTKGKGDE